MEGVTIPDKVAMKGLIWHKARHRRVLPRGTIIRGDDWADSMECFFAEGARASDVGRKKAYRAQIRTRAGKCSMSCLLCYVMLCYVLFYLISSRRTLFVCFFMRGGKQDLGVEISMGGMRSVGLSQPSRWGGSEPELNVAPSGG